jgi:hypothetical protein
MSASRAYEVRPTYAGAPVDRAGGAVAPSRLALPPLLSLQRTAGNAAVCRALQRCGGDRVPDEIDGAPIVQRDPVRAAPVPPALASVEPARDAAKAFLKPYHVGPVWNASGVVSGLVEHLRRPVKDYPFVRAVIAELPSSIEDNVAADLVNRLPMPVRAIGLSAEGRAMLDVLYEAMITGDVSKYERAQAEKIIDYRKGRVSRKDFLAGLGSRMIFPIRNIGITREATATFRAELVPSGKVRVHYTSIRVTQFDMFKADLATLPPWSQLSSGIELDPDQPVAVRLWDVNPIRPVDTPALGLIDFSNQIQARTLDTASTAFFLGLTLGMGGLGGGVISGLRARVAAGELSKAYLWGARALIWADRIQFGIQAGAMIINDHRDWIVKTFPNVGPDLLDAVDAANRIAGYYGWGRLGFDGLRFIGGKLRPAVDGWRAARAEAKLGAQDAKLARAVEDEADALLAELAYAEEKNASNAGRAGGPAGGETRKVVAGGEKEIHVHEDRIEVCPVQRCPDLRETVGPAIADKKVAEEVADAERAARAGDPTAAAVAAEAAVVDAGRATAAPTGKKTAAPGLGERMIKAKKQTGLDVDIAAQEHGAKTTYRKGSGTRVQSAHMVNTSSVKNVAGYVRDEALTVLLPRAQHAQFDKYWKDWAIDRLKHPKPGVPKGMVTVAEWERVLNEAADSVPQLKGRSADTMAVMIRTELYQTLGLKPDQLLRLPFKGKVKVRRRR